MNANQPSRPRTCMVCGSALSEEETSCPLCGAEVTSSLNSTIPSKHTVSPRLKKAALIGASVLSIVCVALLVFSLVDGMNLATNAQAGSQDTNLVGSMPKLADDLGNYPGILSEGGVTCPWNDGLLLSLSDGVYYRSQKDLSHENWQKVLDGSYAYLNLEGDTLYALSCSSTMSYGAASQSSSALHGTRGTEIVKVALDKQVGNSAQPETIYAAPDASHPILYVARKQHVLYALCVDTSTSSLLLRIELGEGNGPVGDTGSPTSVANSAQTVRTFPSADAQIFVGANAVTAVYNDEHNAWVVEQSHDGGTNWTAVMGGNGVINATCFLGNDLYYSTQDGGNSSSLRKQSLAGNFQDISAAQKVMNIAGTESALVTKSSSNVLGWVSPTSNVWHDLSNDAATSEDGMLSSARLSTFNNWAIADFGKSALFVDMNNKLQPIVVKGSS